MTRKFFKYAVVAVLLISSIICLSGCGKNDEKKEEEVSKEIYQKPVITFLEGVKNKSLEQVLQVYPEFMHMEKMIDQENVEEQNKSIADYDYSIGEGTKIDEDGINKLTNQFKALYPDVGDIKIDKAYIVTVSLTKVEEVPEPEQTEESDTKTEVAKPTKGYTKDYYVYCYEGNWYMY